MKNDIEQILGAGGGGGDAHTPVDSPNSLLSLTTARVMFLTSDGEIQGLADQTNKLKSVYLNNVPAMNADGTLNFASVIVDERYGLPSQSVIPGFPSVSSAFNIGTKITVSAPVIYTSSTSAVDAIRVSIRFPALFTQQTNGDTTGATVNFQIYTALGAGSYSLIKDVTKTDKCTSPADVDYLINRPSGSGTWSVKVVRVTADNVSTTLANDIYFQVSNELQYAVLPYNNRAVIGLTVTAAATGTTYPLVSFDLYGLKVKVPSNYNPVTRVYSGTWSGTFASSKQWTNNPAWVLYDLLTNTTHGMGLAASDIDQYSFYDAAVYNDGLVPALVNGSVSGTEPRYVFNYQLMAQDSAWQTIQNIAASFGAVVYTSGNRAKLVQDRPTGFSRLITNSNVEDGVFEYTSSQLNTRQSACKVYWNDPSQNYLSIPAYYEDAAGTTRYGLAVQTVTGLGITSEGQALRLAKWHVDTSLNNTDAVVFKVGFANAGMEPGEVIKIADTDYGQTLDLEAKVVSTTTSTVTFDRTINVTSGMVMDIVGSDGTTIYTRTITSTGALVTVSFSGAAIAVSTNADVVFTGAVSPRLFKITDVKEDGPGHYTVSAVSYDPNKFGRVDSTPTGIVPTFQAPALIPSAVLNLAFREGSTNNNGVIQRSLMVSWSRPVTGTVKDYLLRYRRANTSWVEVYVNASSYQLDNVLEGQYDVQVFPRTTINSMGPLATGSYTITSAGGGTTLLNAPTALALIGGGTSFSGQDINFTWTNPSTNASIAATLKDFEVRFIETTGSTTVRTVYLPYVNAGASQTGSYTYAMNNADGGPRRTVQVQVRCRDSNNNLSNPVTATFSNPAPAVVTPTISSGIGTTFIKMTRPADPDFQAFLLWGSTTSGFTPALGNLIYEGDGSSFTHAGLTDSTTWYYKAAAYDLFGKDYAGTGLNVSTQVSATTSAGANVNEYELNGVTWTPNSPLTNQVAWSACTAIQTLGVGMGASWAVSAGSATWSSGILYIYYVAGASTLSSTTALATALASTSNIIVATYRGGTNLEVGNGRAYLDGSFVIAGTVAASAIVTGSLTSASGVFGSLGITNASIANLDGGKITANTVTAAQINSNGLTIKDTLGNVILSAGTNIPTDAATAGGWNPQFSDWTGTYPTGWTLWTGTTVIKETSLVRTGPFAAKWTTGGVDSGMYRQESYSVPKAAGTFVQGAVDMYVVSSSSAGTPGLLVRLFTNAALTTFVDNVVPIPSTTSGVWQRVPFTARAGNVPVYGLIIYVMAAWAGFSGGTWNGTVVFDNLTFDYRDGSTDNTQVTVNANGTLSGAGGGTVTIGGLGYTGDLNASSDIQLYQSVGAGHTVTGNTIANLSNSSWTSSVASRNAQTGAAYCAFSPATGAYYIAGLSTTQTVTAPNMAYSVITRADGNISSRENGATETALGTYVVGDVIGIEYDGSNVRYLKNGAVLRTITAAANQVLYFEASVIGNSISGCRFGPLTSNNWVSVGGTGKPTDNATRDVSLVPRVSCYVTGNTIGKAGGSAAWDSDVYSTNPIGSGCVAYATVASTGWNIMFGLNTDPTTDANYTSIDYAMYFDAGGNVSKYESGVGTAMGTYTAGSTGAVMYDGSYVRYFLNGTQIGFTYIGGISNAYYFDSSFYTVGGQLTNVRFLPVGNASAVQVGQPITSGLASTFIASAAIGLAQINTASFGSLSALSATIGTLRTATSGARTEIYDNVIKIYDASNVLRVKIGNLAL